MRAPAQGAGSGGNGEVRGGLRERVAQAACPDQVPHVLGECIHVVELRLGSGRLSAGDSCNLFDEECTVHSLPPRPSFRA